MKAFIRKHSVTLLLLLLLSVPLTAQTFQPGFFVGDDGEWMIIRSSAFHEAFRDGQIPVRYLGRLNHEFGYPVATFLYPGYLYLNEPLILVGFSFIESIKIMFAITMVFSGIFAYLWLSKLFDKWSAFLGSLVYLYTPYHLVDMYSRGSLGELLALAVVPFILWNIERRSFVFTAMGIAGLIISHNIMAALFLPIVFVYAFLRRQKQWKKSIKPLGVLLLTSLGLSAFFWLPALFELSSTVFYQTKISEWQNYFAPIDRVGILQIVLITASFGVFVRKKQFKDGLVALFFILLGLLAVFFSSVVSTPLWYILPVSFIQFPFRFLSAEILAVAYVSAYHYTTIKHTAFRVIYTVIIILALAFNAYPYFQNLQPFDKGEGFYVTNQSTTTTRDEYMPVWVREKPVERVENKIEVMGGKGEISNVSLTNKYIRFSVSATSDIQIRINKIYWPGWMASIDGRETTITYDNPKGLMELSVPVGAHTVTLSFEETPLRLFADSITVLTILFLFGISLTYNSKKRNTYINI